MRLQKGEQLIANALGVEPAEIWPSRYFDDDGNKLERKARDS
ncbi:helix-turn-helix domain-containing protein [Pectobacterium brasiliense]